MRQLQRRTRTQINLQDPIEIVLIKLNRKQASSGGKAIAPAADSSQINTSPIEAGKVLGIRELGLAVGVKVDVEVRVEAERSQTTRNRGRNAC